MKTDIQIAQEAKMLPIKEVAASIGIMEDDLELYGKYKAKLSDELMERSKNNPNGKLILVTAINPTPAGEGKTTTSVGLGQAFGKLGKKALLGKVGERNPDPQIAKLEEEIMKEIEELGNKILILENECQQGINIEKQFITPQRSNSDLSSRIIVRKGQFAYCTQLNNENVAIAYREGEDCVVSPVYNAFEIKPSKSEELLPKYLFLWVKRREFGRYVYWKSVGSAYEFLQEENLCEYKMPIPPIEVQRSIVKVYTCLEESKKIASEAREKLKTLCPALVQRAANS